MEFRPGDIVYIRGPYVITRKVPGDTYEIEPIVKLRKIKYPVTAHVSQLKIWRGSTGTECENMMDESENVIPDVEAEVQNSHIPVDDIENNIDEDVSVKHVAEYKDRPKRKSRKPAYLSDFV